MITNDRQYKIAKSQIENFEQSLDSLTLSISTAKNIHPKLFEVQRNAIESKLKDLQTEVQEYEDLKAGKVVVTEVNSLNELPIALIKARIANGLTQAELAERIGIKMQQIQKYEAEKYDSASLKTLQKVAENLEIKINADIQIKTVETLDAKLNINNYPFKQMFKRKWFENFLGSYNEAVLSSKSLLESFFELAGFNNLQYSFTKKSIRSNSTFNEFALNAWYAKVLIKARSQQIQTVFNKSIITTDWLKQLAELSIEKDSPIKAVDYLKNSGIRFVIEPQLEGTYLDGAALLLEDKSPLIAMTLRHDRLDNFWFVLFHEIAHVYLHLSDTLTVIFDDLDVLIEGIEKEADDFALNALIPDVVWKRSLVRFSPSKETIVNQAKVLKVHPALVAGRIRRETGRYHQFSDLIGLGEVRANFERELNN